MELEEKAAPLYRAIMFDALTDYEPANREIAIGALFKIIPKKKALLESLKQIQTNKWQPQTVVKRIEKKDKELIAEISSALSDEHPMIKKRAVWAASFIPDLLEKLKRKIQSLENDPDEQVRKEVKLALERLNL